MRRTRRELIMAVVAALLLMAGSPGSAKALPQIGAEAFQPSSNCGCHAALLEQWGASMHSKALDDPLYLYKLEEANKATDGALGAFCNTCHGPVATMSGEITDLSGASAQSREGVACGFCHHVTGTGQPIANVSQSVQADGVMRAQFDDAVSPFHETAYSGFHQTAEFCGSCHNVDHPVNGLHLESTYTEWKEGPYAPEGIVCQDCHMTPGPGVTKPYPGTAAAGGPQRDHIYQMTFAGGNVGLGDSVRAEERLQAAATIELRVPEVIETGTPAQAQVVITNSGAGHFLPTGLTEVRQMWLEVTIAGEEQEPTVIGTHEFGTVLEDADGNSPVELWEAVAFASDDRIPPKESVTDTFDFEMPDADKVDVVATLYYRSCTEEMADAAGVEIPTTTMASVSQPVFTSAAERAAYGRENGDGGNAIALAAAVFGLAFLTGAAWWTVRSRAKRNRAKT